MQHVVISDMRGPPSSPSCRPHAQPLGIPPCEASWKLSSNDPLILLVQDIAIDSNGGFPHRAQVGLVAGYLPKGKLPGVEVNPFLTSLRAA